MGKKGSSSAVRIDSNDIRSLIKQNGIKQKDLAYLIGYTPEGFSRSLRLGKMERFEDVEKMAEILNVNPFSLIASNDDSDDSYKIHYDYASYFNNIEGKNALYTDYYINGKLLKKIISLKNKSVDDISDYLEAKPQYIVDIIDNKKSIDLTNLVFLSYYLNVDPTILFEQKATYHQKKPELLDDNDLAEFLKQNEFKFGPSYNSTAFINLFFGDDSRLEFVDLTSKRTIMRLIHDSKEELIYHYLQFIKEHPDKFTTDELKLYLLDNLAKDLIAHKNELSGK